MKASAFLSVALAGAVGAWMLSGALSDRGDLGAQSPAPSSEPAAPAPASPLAMKVQVVDLHAQPVARELVVQGQLEPRRRVEVRAETAGLVVELPVAKGRRVKAGEPLVRLAEEDRRAQIARAEAEVRSRELVVDGQRNLKNKGLQAETQLKAAEAALAAARAELERLRLDLARTRIIAPFDGVVESRPVEQGSLVERDDPVAELVDDAVLLAVGDAPQQGAGALAPGQPVQVRLLDGHEAEGRLSFVASVAEPGTRSFRVEAEIENPDGRLSAGISAELRVRLGEDPAHFLSPAALTLDDLGQVGVKSVSADDRVEFHPVSLVRTESNGVWVAGLPDRVRVIVQGQGFVTAGEQVEPVVADREQWGHTLSANLR
jgi:multidrug efflux system membrane fusion protein